MTVDFINVKTNLSPFFFNGRPGRKKSFKQMCLLTKCFFSTNMITHSVFHIIFFMNPTKTLFQSEGQMVCNILSVCEINVINSITNHSSTSQLQKLNYFFHGVSVLFYHSFLHPGSWICIFQKTTFSVKKQITKLKRFSLIVKTNDGISLPPLQTFKNNVMIQYFTVYIYIKE